jgi:hypothetical protein
LVFGWTLTGGMVSSRTPASRRTGCEAHKSGFVRGAPGKPGAPTRVRREGSGILPGLPSKWSERRDLNLDV